MNLKNLIFVLIGGGSCVVTVNAGGIFKGLNCL